MNWNLSTIKKWADSIRAPRPETAADIAKDIAAIKFYENVSPDSQEMWDHFLDVLAWLSGQAGGVEKTTVRALLKTSMPSALKTQASLELMAQHFLPWYNFRKNMYPKVTASLLFNEYKQLLDTESISMGGEGSQPIADPPITTKETAPQLPKRNIADSHSESKSARLHQEAAPADYINAFEE